MRPTGGTLPTKEKNERSLCAQGKEGRTHRVWRACLGLVFRAIGNRARAARAARLTLHIIVRASGARVEAGAIGQFEAGLTLVTDRGRLTAGTARLAPDAFPKPLVLELPSRARGDAGTCCQGLEEAGRTLKTLVASKRRAGLTGDITGLAARGCLLLTLPNEHLPIGTVEGGQTLDARAIGGLKRRWVRLVTGRGDRRRGHLAEGKGEVGHGVHACTGAVLEVKGHQEMQ